MIDLPSNLDAEASVLGAIILAPEALDACAELISPADFSRASNGEIFAAALELHARGHAVDLITLGERLPQHAERLREIAQLVPTSANAAHHARIVREQAVYRSLVTAGQEITRLGAEHPQDAHELLDRAGQIVYRLAAERETGTLTPIDGDARAVYQRTRELAEAPDGIVGTPSGLAELDKLTRGFRPGNLVIVAARPSMGKSSLALNVTQHLTIRRGLPVAFFTLEMSREELSERLVASEARVSLQNPRRLDGEQWTRLEDAGVRVSQAPLYIRETGTISVSEIRSQVRRLKHREPELALVVVDYLQLMVGGKAEHRTAEVGAVSRELKLAARDTDTPFLVLSQLNRNLEARPDKRPLLSDLRESGAIEQDADLVLFIYRDAYYKKEPSPEEKGVAELILAKQRNGPTGLVRVGWREEVASFSNLLQLVRAEAA